MKKVTVIVVLLLILSALLSSCSSPDENYTPPEAVIRSPETVYIKSGYTVNKKYEYHTYMMAYRTLGEIDREKETLAIDYSHGYYAPWNNGGYVYPDVENVKVLVKNDAGEELLLLEDEFFAYIDTHFYAEGISDSTLKKEESNKLKWYGSADEEGFIREIDDAGFSRTVNPNNEAYFSNRETVKLPLEFFPSEEGYIVFEIRELYPDESEVTVRATYLYYKNADGALEFSSAQFGEAEQ